MRKYIVILIGILILAGVAFGSYWYFQNQTSEDPMPESGIFVWEDSSCKHFM